MWNIKSGNKLIDRHLKENAQQRHMQALKKIRGLVDHTSPKAFNFLYSRPKANQIKREREMDIQYNNSMLVSKMIGNSSLIPPSAVDLKHSLSTPFRNRVEREIYTNNKKLVHRLQTAKSQYSRSIKYNRDFDKYRISLAYSRMAPFYDFHKGYRLTNRPLSSKR